MNQAEIKKIIEQNLTNAQFTIDDLRVQPDPFVGWIIAVISPEFAGKSYNERREIVLKGLETIIIEWLDLMTPEERNSSAPLPLDSDLEDVPLWPEALARGSGFLTATSKKKQEKIIFPADLDENLKPPLITTFYSFKGGVGRSTALAYTARSLARKGLTVLCVDLDLEAPSLASLFGKDKEVKEETGLLSILLKLDQGGQPNIQKDLIKISNTDELYCLSPGKLNANYARLLDFLDFSAWYREERNPLRELIHLLSYSLTFKPDVILLDAGRGISELNAPLLFDLADLAIVVFFPHPQVKEGNAALVRALLASNTRRSESQLTPEPRFLVSPIPGPKASEVMKKYQYRALEWIRDWLSEVSWGNSSLNESEITHFIPYREVIATSDEILADSEIWRDFEAVAEWIELLLPQGILAEGSKKELIVV